MLTAPIAKRTMKNRYRLIGTKCLNCNEVFMPPRSMCPNCRRSGKIEEIELSGEGEIYSYTIIKTAPEGFEINTPYVIGIIKLKEGPFISSQIINNGKEIKIGRKVRSVFRRIFRDDNGLINYGLKFEVCE